MENILKIEVELRKMAQLSQTELWTKANELGIKNKYRKKKTELAKEIYIKTHELNKNAIQQIKEIDLETNIFENIISLKEASEIFGKDESTLRRNIANGKFIEEIDCKKYGKQWVFNINALYREYGYKSLRKDPVIWKDIKGYEGKYKINNYGDVINKENGTKVKVHINKIDGHKRLTLSLNGEQKIKALHRILAETFIPNPENKPGVHHIDENKLNNNLDNLMWVTEEEHGKIRSEEHYKKFKETYTKNKIAREKMKKDL